MVDMVMHPGSVKTDMDGPPIIATVEESTNELANVKLKASKTSPGKFFNFRKEELPW